MQSVIALVILFIAAKALTPAGVYRLVSVAGRPLPALWQETRLVGDANLRTFWVSGQAEFKTEGQYSVLLTLRTTGPGVLGEPVVTTATGRWRSVGSGWVELEPIHGGRARWQAAGDTLTMRARVNLTASERGEQVSFVFVRTGAPGPQ